MNRNEVREISVFELKEMMDNKEDYAVLDVREPDEVEICHINDNINVPLGLLDKNTNKIPKDKKTIVYCRSGKRSFMAALFLQQEHGYENLYNLSGGIIAYATHIEKEMTLY